MHHNQIEQCHTWTLNNTHHLHKLRVLTVEIPHNSPTGHFSLFAQLLATKELARLSELGIFGVGPDLYNTKTSSVAHPCGKHDISLTLASMKKLHSMGQGWQRRLDLLNSLQCLSKLTVLTLDNLNMPISHSHILKNKPRLERLRLSADPRSELHCDYLNHFGLAIFTLPQWLPAPPIKEVQIDSNAIVSATQVMSRIAPTVEKVDLVIPLNFFQTSEIQFDFLSQAARIFEHLSNVGKKLQTLKLCVHGAIYETSTSSATFMGAFKNCVPRFRELKALELHIQSESPWLAQEFLHAVPSNVERLYLTDTLVKGDTHNLFTILNEENGHLIQQPPQDDAEFRFDIARELSRQDFISFKTRLGFVGYEFNVVCTSRDSAMDDFLKLNGKLLDRERNKHLTKHKGRHIPWPEFLNTEHVRTCHTHASRVEVDANREALESCGLLDNDYYGLEDEAEMVFWNEPVAKADQRLKHLSFIDVVDVGSDFKESNHWLSH